MCAAALVFVLDTLTASPLLFTVAADYFGRWYVANHYTYRLDAPRVFVGTRFPAGSEVSTDPDGQPVHGKIPVPTTVLGLELVGAFRAFQGTSLSYVESGTLASEGLIDGVPCGPGPFDHPVIDTVRCTLARNTPVAAVRAARGNRRRDRRSP